jgi:Tfp pilus assembly protein FimT
MSLWKLVIVVVLLGVLGLFAYDGVQVLDARKNITNTATVAASAAAHAIATEKVCKIANPKTFSKTCDPATAAANAAKSQGDVVTAYTYDAVAAKVSVTVSGTAKSLVLHYFDRNLTDNIRASSSARPE